MFSRAVVAAPSFLAASMRRPVVIVSGLAMAGATIATGWFGVFKASTIHKSPRNSNQRVNVPLTVPHSSIVKQSINSDDEESRLFIHIEEQEYIEEFTFESLFNPWFPSHKDGDKVPLLVYGALTTNVYAIENVHTAPNVDHWKRLWQSRPTLEGAVHSDFLSKEFGIDDAFKDYNIEFTSRYTNNDDPDDDQISGIVLRNEANGHLVIVQMGTSSMKDAKQDLSLHVGRNGFHQGFMDNAAEQMAIITKMLDSEEKRWSDYSTITLTGHSLGGAMSEAMAYRLLESQEADKSHLEVVTFGSPDMFTSKFMEEHPERFQVDDDGNWSMRNSHRINQINFEFEGDVICDGAPGTDPVGQNIEIEDYRCWGPMCHHFVNYFDAISKLRVQI